MSTNVLTDRQREAIAALFYVRKGVIRKYAKKRPFGSDAYIAGEAKTLALNPYRMPSEFIMLFNSEQTDFLWEMNKVWERTGHDAKFRKQAEAEVREEILS